MKAKEVKPGYKTTEFWMVLMAMGLTGSGMGVDPEHVSNVTNYGPVVVASIYAIGRSIVKFFTG